MVMTKTAPHDTEQAVSFMKNFFNLFPKIMSQPNTPSAADLEKILSKNFTITQNGHLIANSLAAYAKRAENLHKKYSHFQMKANLISPLAESNKVLVNYDL